MTEPLYMPDPALFGHGDAYRLYTRFAAGLEEAGLRDRLPADPELRNIVIELLAERYAVEDLVEMPDEFIPEAVHEARAILAERRSKGS